MFSCEHFKPIHSKLCSNWQLFNLAKGVFTFKRSLLTEIDFNLHSFSKFRNSHTHTHTFQRVKTGIFQAEETQSWSLAPVSHHPNYIITDLKIIWSNTWFLKWWSWCQRSRLTIHKAYSNMQPSLRYSCISIHLILVNPPPQFPRPNFAHWVLMVVTPGLP